MNEPEQLDLGLNVPGVPDRRELWHASSLASFSPMEKTIHAGTLDAALDRAFGGVMGSPRRDLGSQLISRGHLNTEMNNTPDRLASDKFANDKYGGGIGLGVRNEVDSELDLDPTKGLYYRNESEGVGSTSVVVPNAVTDIDWRDTFRVRNFPVITRETHEGQETRHLNRPDDEPHTLLQPRLFPITKQGDPEPFPDSPSRWQKPYTDAGTWQEWHPWRSLRKS